MATLCAFYRGGFFAGKIKSPEDPGPKGGRFDANTYLGKLYRERVLKKNFFRALSLLKEVTVSVSLLVQARGMDTHVCSLKDRHEIRLTEAALRWMQHHSLLKPTDGVLVGASNIDQLKQNLADNEKGPLPEEVVKALDEAARIVQNDAPKYWF